MSRTINGNHRLGIQLTNPGDNPVSITSGASITSQFSAVQGSAGVYWSITNSGHIEGGNHGIYLDGGGSITNLGFIGSSIYTDVEIEGAGAVTNGSATDTSATIDGASFGVQIRGGLGAVTNFATITAHVYDAVALKGGGSVVNGTAADTTASILGQGNGVEILAASGSVTNFATIVGTSASGVYLGGGGAVTNGSASDTGASISGAKVGVDIRVTPGQLTNFGTVSGTGTHGLAVYFSAGGSVVNGAAGSGAATLSGVAYGVAVIGGPATVTNDGTITASGAAATAIGLFAGGTVTNAAGASISAARYGVYVGYGAALVVNAGDIAGQVGVRVGSAAGSATVVNAGTITGSGGTAVGFGSGDDRMVIDPGAVFAGAVVGSASGHNVLELASAASAGTLSGVGTGFTNFATVAIDPAAKWTLAGADQLASAATLSLGAGATLSLAGAVTGGASLLLTGSGILAVAGTGRLEVGGAGTGALGAVTVDAGSRLLGRGVVRAAFTDNGTIEARAGTLTLAGGVGGAGVVAIDANSVLTVNGALGEAAMVFMGGHGELALGSPAKATALISGFVAGETIDLVAKVATSETFANGVLTVASGSATVATLHFAGSYTSASFTLGTDGHGGTTITHA